MKTVWDQKTIERKSTPSWKWVREKQIEFEAQTGVKWTAFSAQGKHKFMPTWDWNEAIEGTEEEREFLLGAVGIKSGFAKTFLQVQKFTGMDLGKLMGIVKSLSREGKVVPVVGRNGKAIGYYRGKK